MNHRGGTLLALALAAALLILPAARAEEMPIVNDEPLVLTERFVPLFEKSREVVGWLDAGSQIHEPIAFRDNDYYLHHDLSGSYSQDGTVFADEEFESWQNDPYVLLYGHNMRSGAMFGYLDSYLDKQYLAENARVQVYTPYSQSPIEYVPFAALDMCAIPGEYGYFPLRCFDDFRVPADESKRAQRDERAAEILNTIRSRAMWSLSEIDVGPGDRILGLVTCSYHYENGRLILFLRALRPGETPEGMQSLVEKSIEKW